MNELQIFNNSEFGEIRTIASNDEVLFCLGDLCRALELTAKGVKQRLSDEVISNYPIADSLGRTQNTLFVNEDGMYDVVLESRKENARKFRKWVTSEVLPSIRKTGSYGKPMTTAEQIKLLAQGNTELNERVEKVEDKIYNLENDMPLYGCEIDEVCNHVKRKAVDVLGGKNSEAYHDSSIRGKVFSDIYTQIKREYGLVSSYKSIKRKYLADVHDFIDCYQPPRVIEEMITDANAQMRIA